jgi:thiol-disulfide isomerase/thioredoxin
MSMLYLAVVVLTLLPSDQAEPKLKIGDPAPSLAVAQWVKGEPVKTFEPGKTYVVDFWATWCGPCRASMPHLTGLQKSYKDRVTVISVSVAEEDQAKVEPFVQKMGEMMGFAVALDDIAAGDVRGQNGPMMRLWLKAAGLDGIPNAFIVSHGKIAWIGHPDGLDGPLDKVLSGQWDFESAARARRQKLAANRRYQEVVWPKLGLTFRAGRPTDETVAVIKKAIADDPSIECGDAGRYKFQFLLECGRVDEAVRYGERLVDSVFQDEPFPLRVIAWLIVDEMPGKGGDRRKLALALRAARRARELTHDRDARALDVLSQVLFAMGDVEQALLTEQEAVGVAGAEASSEMKERLEQYRTGAARKAP